MFIVIVFQQLLCLQVAVFLGPASSKNLLMLWLDAIRIIVVIPLLQSKHCNPLADVFEMTLVATRINIDWQLKFFKRKHRHMSWENLVDLLLYDVPLLVG